MKRGLSERDIQRAIIDILRWHGWMVREISQPRVVSGDLVGVPDVIAFRYGHTLLIECKRPGGRIRQSQVNFSDEIKPHMAITLRYMLANDIDVFTAALDEYERMMN